MKTLAPLALFAAVSASYTHAQVLRYEGPSPNLTTALDFDNPFVPTGPIGGSSATFTGVGISAATLVGAPFTAAGDTLTPGSNVNGQCLVARNGALAVAGPNQPLDNIGIGAGFQFTLAAPVAEFQALFTDDLDFVYDVELFLGGTSLGIGHFAYLNGAFPAAPHYWRATGSSFDRVRITFPLGAPGVGLDELAFGNGPQPAPPSNNECTSATTVVLGNTSFDNSNATLSAPAWGCSSDVGADVWFRYVNTVMRDVRFSTCGSSFDTTLQVFSGGCTGLTPVGCNDDACGRQSTVVVLGAPGATVYYLRVGGWRGDTGPGMLTINEHHTNPGCVTTIFGSNNQGNAGGAVYFDLTVTQNVAFTGLELNSASGAGTAVGLEVYTFPGTYVGNAGSQTGWTLAAMDDTTSVTAGVGARTMVTFAAPMALTPGTYGIALVGRNTLSGAQMAHAYTNGTGGNQSFMTADGVLRLSLGAADNVPFSGAGFTPRVWNGTLCYVTASIGTSYCTANANSTGAPGRLDAFGSPIVSANSVELVASSLPPGAFNYFLVSPMQGFTANPGGSQGNLCLSGQIGRYVGPGLIIQANAMGERRLALDITAIPLPVGTTAATVGSTYNWQCWYRDQNPGITSNFTEGTSITFQ